MSALVACGNCGYVHAPTTGYTGAATYHRHCARLVYGDEYQEYSSAGRPSVEEALAAVGVARERHADAEVSDPAARVLDALGREWARQTNGGWGAIGSTATADCFAEIDAKYGPCEVLG